MVDPNRFLGLPDKSVRIVMYSTDNDVIYDRIFTEAPSIEQLKEIREVAKISDGEFKRQYLGWFTGEIGERDQSS